MRAREFVFALVVTLAIIGLIALMTLLFRMWGF